MKIFTPLRMPLLGVLLVLPQLLYCATGSEPLSSSYFQTERYKGKVVDPSGDPLVAALLAVNGSNISTVTNADGVFSLIIPADIDDAHVTVSHLGFQSRSLPLEFFRQEEVVIALQETVEELSEVRLLSYTDPRSVVRNMLRNRGSNYLDAPTTMTAFYRETIKQRKRNVSLSEAVVRIYKSSYGSSGDDDIALVKARKTADYDRLDTIALKLRGGPYNPLSVDLMKDPTYLFGEYDLENFEFTFAHPTKVGDRYLYVIDFQELDQGLPWYHGKLYIDAESFTLVRTSFDLNVDNRNAAADLFVKKKPGGTRVYPVSVHYDVQYRERDGKWYFGYAITQLEFVVDWKRRLFNSRYAVNSELAITDWKINTAGRVKRDSSFLSERVVMGDDVSGFTDVDFWGENNIIEPDKSIENAIEKIRERIRGN